MKKTYVHTHSKWFAKEAHVVIDRLESDAQHGLNTQEVEARQQQFGLNVLPEKPKESALIRFFRHFHDILIYILLLAAFITLILGHYADTIVIVLVAFVNACIGFFQESKAEKALEDIKAMLSLKATVIRDGKRQEIDASELTIGDLVLLTPGDKVPADLRLIRADNLKIEESALTGEALPSEKQSDMLDADTMLGDRSNMAFSGTTVSVGTGLGVVVAIGLETEIGHISQLISDAPAVTTPLIRQMAEFGKSISFIIIGIAFVVFLFGHFFREYQTTELLLATIGLAIAAIPEGLPAILSIILAIGVQNMAKRQAIVRNLPSVETLGSVSVICSDKTGTLTKNEMTVKSLITCNDYFEVTGSGYEPVGEIQQNHMAVDASSKPLLAELIECFYLCNDSSIGQNEEGFWQVTGDPTEGALLTLHAKTNLKTVSAGRLSTIPFDSEYKYMATLIAFSEKHNMILIKGAPDRLLKMAFEQKDNQDKTFTLDTEYWEQAISCLAGQGQRLLGAAYKLVDKSVQSISHEDVHGEIILLGLAGIMDPPRAEAIDAIAACHQAGISVKMITGDHADTAVAIGKEMGIQSDMGALEGNALNEMTEEQLEKAAVKYSIFARTSPEDKLKLVRALQAQHHICAMTGDGVNDAPALKMADVGIAMGIKGTEVTKDSAEIVLADDDFSTIVAAVEEGRRVYDNLKKTILFILPTNGAESFLIIASILFGTMLPLTPVQILWVNMVTSVTVSLALAFERVEPGVMLRKPRLPNEQLLSGYFIWRILFVSILVGGMTLIMNVILLDRGYSEDIVRTTTLQAIVLCQMFHLFNSRSIRQSAFTMNPFSNKAVIVVCVLLMVLQVSVTYIPVMNRIFGTVPLSLSFWGLTALMGLFVFIIVEIEKWVMRMIDRKKTVAH